MVIGRVGGPNLYWYGKLLSMGWVVWGLGGHGGWVVTGEWKSGSENTQTSTGT